MTSRLTTLEDKRIAFRVGINIGDVIVEAHDIFGDGVNIAARLEGIAEPGGICISSSAYDQVRGKVAVEFADLGEQNLKNIARPGTGLCRGPMGWVGTSTDMHAEPVFSAALVHRSAAVRQPWRRSRTRLLRGWCDREPDHGLVAHQRLVRDRSKYCLHLQRQSRRCKDSSDAN